MGCLFFLPHLFIYAIMDFSQYGPMDIYFLFRVAIQQYFISWLKLLGLWDLFHFILCVLLTCPNYCVFLYISLLSGTRRHSSHILCLPSPGPRISHFSREPCFLLFEHDIRNQGLGAGGKKLLSSMEEISLLWAHH